MEHFLFHIFCIKLCHTFPTVQNVYPYILNNNGILWHVMSTVKGNMTCWYKNINIKFTNCNCNPFITWEQLLYHSALCIHWWIWDPLHFLSLFSIVSTLYSTLHRPFCLYHLSITWEFFASPLLLLAFGFHSSSLFIHNPSVRRRHVQHSSKFSYLVFAVCVLFSNADLCL